MVSNLFQNKSETLCKEDEKVEDQDQTEGSRRQSIQNDENTTDKENEAAEKSTSFMDKLKMVPVFISSIIVSLTLRLHRLTRNYQYVLQVLAREKRTLKVCATFTNS